MILFEGIFSLSFFLVRQPSLNFTVSSSTDKGSEVTFFYWKISILSDLSFGFETLQSRSLNQMAGKQLLFHKHNLSTFCQSWYPRNVHSTAHGLGLCFGFCSFVVVRSRGNSYSRHFGLLLSTKGHFGRGHVLHTLSHDILYPHPYSSVLLLSNLQLSKKKKKKKWNVCPWMKCTWKETGTSTHRKFYLVWKPQAPSPFTDDAQAPIN